MFAACLLSFALAKAQSVDRITLQYYQDAMVARKGASVFRLAIHPTIAPPPTNVEFRRDSTFAVWDERGLCVRSAQGLIVSKLPKFAVSPRLSSRPEIRDTLRLAKQGLRSLEADALSGAKRLGRMAFFLVRWDDANSKPWLEALVQVDLEAPNPKPELLGRFRNLSAANKSIDDRLIVLRDKLAMFGRSGASWSLETYDPATKQFDSRLLSSGPALQNLSSFAVCDGRTAVYVEQTGYGSSRAGTVNLTDGTTSLVTESPGFTRFLDAKQPLLFLEHQSTGSQLANGETGAILPITNDCGIGRVGPYVAVWSPKEFPERADLYDPVRWDRLATWGRASESLQR